jgi:plastocyanin
MMLEPIESRLFIYRSSLQKVYLLCKKFGVTIFFLGVLIVIFFFYSSQSKIVYINRNGFTPERLDINKGTKVIWINSDSRLHWPASDYHPTHTIYPSTKRNCLGSDLDACRGLSKNEKYVFEFNIPGVWGIHDHLFPGSTMTISVKE